MSLAALIFDVDGTLAETEEVHRAAFNEAFRAHGLDWAWSVADYRKLLRTTGGKERIAAFQRTALPAAHHLPPEEIARLHAAKTRLYAARVDAGGLALRPGVAALIAAARARGLRLAVATTTSRPNVESLAAAAWGRPADAVFDVIAAGDEVAAKKPAPDIYRLALDRLGLDAARCLAFEDSRNGLLAARGAGLATIVTPSTYTAHESFEGAEQVLPDLSAFRLDSLASSP